MKFIQKLYNQYQMKKANLHFSREIKKVKKLTNKMVKNCEKEYAHTLKQLQKLS